MSVLIAPIMERKGGGVGRNKALAEMCQYISMDA
jgi:hypothetical protein